MGIRLKACVIAAVALSLPYAGCAPADYYVAVDADASSPAPPPLTSPDLDGGPDDGSAPAEALCMGAECPSSYATCGSSHKCEINLANDEANCGACGNDCRDLPDISLMGTCVDGKCRYECLDISDNVNQNCNGALEDGCEVNTSNDPLHCGGCGHACPPGDLCIDGTCGCPSGFTRCDHVRGNYCADLSKETGNCGDCGNKCPDWWDAGWPEPPPHMAYACSEGECRKLACAGHWANCDGLLSNGCEVDTGADENNCNACGNKCPAGQICGIQLLTRVAMCGCEEGLTSCRSDYLECADLLRNANHCGACGLRCEAPPNSHSIPICNQGRCESPCMSGFADCDGDPRNGCEADLRTDGSNCGACGHWCNAAAGQPCLDGECLMVGCDSGVPVLK